MVPAFQGCHGYLLAAYGFGTLLTSAHLFVMSLSKVRSTINRRAFLELPNSIETKIDETVTAML